MAEGETVTHLEVIEDIAISQYDFVSRHQDLSIIYFRPQHSGLEMDLVFPDNRNAEELPHTSLRWNTDFTVVQVAETIKRFASNKANVGYVGIMEDAIFEGPSLDEVISPNPELLRVNTDDGALVWEDVIPDFKTHKSFGLLETYTSIGSAMTHLLIERTVSTSELPRLETVLSGLYKVYEKYAFVRPI